MFKWVCLSIATIGMAIFLWMINDIRMAVKGTTRRMDSELFPLIENSEKAVDCVNQRLPDLVDKAEGTMTVVADVSDDIRQYKEMFASQYSTAQAKELTGYVHDLLDFLQTQNASIGLKKADQTIKTVTTVSRWTQEVRKEASVLGLASSSREEVVKKMSTSRSGDPWQIQHGDDPPKPLADWIRENHPKKKT
jgi:hypothetical protein